MKPNIPFKDVINNYINFVKTNDLFLTKFNKDISIYFDNIANLKLIPFFYLLYIIFLSIIFIVGISLYYIVIVIVILITFLICILINTYRKIFYKKSIHIE